MLDFSKVISYSRTMCVPKSMCLCATYVKKAFQAGGLKYISGNGWDNQRWCQANDFMCIGDFIPEKNNPRNPASVETSKICNVNGLQFPRMADGSIYKQQLGDVCLIEHGQWGHICYAMSSDINDWVSDYFQHPPGQRSGTGPYCYQSGITRVQFWRHSSVLNNTPSIDLSTLPPYDITQSSGTSGSTSGGSTNNTSAVNPQEIASMNSNRTPHTVPGNVLGMHLRQN